MGAPAIDLLTHLTRPAVGAPEGALVLLHGRGTDERDLLPLADALDPERRLVAVTPRAPWSFPGQPGVAVDFAHQARERLLAAHVDPLYRETPGMGHTIDPAFVPQLRDWLAARTPAPA